MEYKRPGLDLRLSERLIDKVVLWADAVLARLAVELLLRLIIFLADDLLKADQGKKKWR